MVAESGAIIEYIVEKYGAGRLMPKDEPGRLRYEKRGGEERGEEREEERGREGRGEGRGERRGERNQGPS